MRQYVLLVLLLAGCSLTPHPMAPWINQPHAPLCVQACQGLFNECIKSALMPMALGGLGASGIFTITIQNPFVVTDCRVNLRCCYDACTVWQPPIPGGPYAPSN